MSVKKFVYLVDLHYGYERKSGHKLALHDPRAMDLALQFVSDFKPDTLILGGDILDCGAVSHHNQGKPGRTEGMRIIADAKDCAREFIDPLNHSAYIPTKVYIIGNHEGWLTDAMEEQPQYEGMLDIDVLLPLGGWTIIPRGSHYNLGKMTFMHGDQLSGGEHVAKQAVTTFERSVRFGHFHTYQAFTKTTPIDNKLGKTGVCVPCLCKKDMAYAKGKPNRWVQGINFGYVFADGTYSDQVSLITNGRLVGPDGKVYKA